MKPSRLYHLTHLFKHDSHSFHGGVLSGYLAVDVQRPVQDLSHFIRVDDGVVLGQISVQLLDLVLQILNLCLERLQTHTHTHTHTHTSTHQLQHRGGVWMSLKQRRFDGFADARWSASEREILVAHQTGRGGILRGNHAAVFTLSEDQRWCQLHRSHHELRLKSQLTASLSHKLLLCVHVCHHSNMK